MNQHVPPTKTFVTIDGRALKSALAPILSVVEKRYTYPILGCVKVALAGAQLTLTGTDLDIEVVSTLDVIDGSGDWAVAIDAPALAGIARVAGVMPVRIERIERTVTLSRGKDRSPATEIVVSIRLGDGDAEYELQAMDADAFPALGGTRGDLIERFTNGMLGTILGKVRPFISTEETRYYLNGVCWQDGPTGRRVVATDGHRLGICRYSPSAGGKVWNRIIPTKTVVALLNHAKGRDVSAFDAGKGKVEFAFQDITVRSKLIEGTYPDVDRVIPDSGAIAQIVEFPVAEIVAAVDRAGIVGSRFQSRAIRFFEHEGHVALECRSADLGKATVQSQAAYPPGMPEFALNASYLRDMAGRCENRVSLLVKDASTAVRIGDADETMTRLLMPMRY